MELTSGVAVLFGTVCFFNSYISKAGPHHIAVPT